MVHEHIEHAEHAQHHAHDSFDRKVALTISIVAAILAAVVLLSHRAHTETLRLQGESVRLKTEASTLELESFNKWSLYQAQNIRMHNYQSLADLATFLSPRSGAEEKFKEQQDKWAKTAKSYEGKLEKWRKEAEGLQKEAENKRHESLDYVHKSHEMHIKADRYDLGELFVEIAVVVCSVSILVKRRTFWYLGMVLCTVGLAVALTGYFDLFLAEVEHHPTNGSHHSIEHKSTDKHNGHDGEHKEKSKTEPAH